MIKILWLRGDLTNFLRAKFDTKLPENVLKKLKIIVKKLTPQVFDKQPIFKSLIKYLSELYKWLTFSTSDPTM